MSAFNALTNNNATGEGGVLAHTTVGPDPVLFAVVTCAHPARNLSYLRWDGDAFTLLKSESWGDGGTTYGYHFGIFPSPGIKTANVTYDLDGTCFGSMAAWSYKGAAQTDVFGVVKTDKDQGPPVSLTMENAKGQLIIDILMSSWPGSAVGTHAVGANQTDRGGTFRQGGDGADRIRCSVSDELAASRNVDMTWTISAAKWYGQAAVPIKRPSAGGVIWIM